MNNNSGHGHGTQIQPIPPPLEFPFPGNSAEAARSLPTTQPTSNASLNNDERRNHIARKDHGTENKQLPLADHQLPTEQSPTRSSTQQRPSKREPAPTKAKGRQAAARSALSSSEDEDDRPKPRRTHTALKKRGKKGSEGGRGEDATGRDSNAERYGKFSVGNDDFKTKGKVDKTSGRLDISVNETNNRGYLAKALGASLHHHLNPHSPRHGSAQPSGELEKTATQESGLRRPDLVSKVSTSLGVPITDEFSTVPTLNIVIMVIGSRGDIQPFLKIGKLLKEVSRFWDTYKQLPT